MQRVSKKPSEPESPTLAAHSVAEGSYLDWYKSTIPPHWTVPSHIGAIAEHLDAATRGEIDRLAIFMPPRHGKTETVTIRYPVFRLARDPSINCLITGYNERFARRLGRRTRNLAQGLGLVPVASDKAASDEWLTKAGGGLLARGAGSPPTGIGFNIALIDDAIRKREDAESEVFREKLWDWYTDDIYTRLEPGALVTLVMTLWHEDDIGARIVGSEPGKWTVLKLPAIAEEGDPMGRKPGEALWPERYGEAQLERIRQTMSRTDGERSWQALYQQNPTPREGAFFKVGKIEFVEPSEVPRGLPSVRRWDMAATKNDGDFTVGARVTGPDSEGIYYVEDVVRGQWDTSFRNKVILATAEADGPTIRIIGPQDPGAAGKEAAQAFIRLLAGYPVSVELETGSKEVKADPLSSQVNAGNVRFVRAPWNRPAIEELRAFPHGKHDDQADAIAGAFNALARKREIGVTVV